MTAKWNNISDGGTHLSNTFQIQSSIPAPIKSTQIVIPSDIITPLDFELVYHDHRCAAESVNMDSLVSPTADRSSISMTYDLDHDHDHDQAIIKHSLEIPNPSKILNHDHCCEDMHGHDTTSSS